MGRKGRKREKGKREREREKERERERLLLLSPFLLLMCPLGTTSHDTIK